MTVYSYGILLYRKVHGKKNRKHIEVFLINPDGPHFRKRSFVQQWGFPKGRREAGETPLIVAKREFCEEVGVPAPDIAYEMLEPLVTPRGKVISIFAGNATGISVIWDGSKVLRKTHGQGSEAYSYGETKDGQWFPIDQALKVIGKGQRTVLEEFINKYRVRVPANSR